MAYNNNNSTISQGAPAQGYPQAGQYGTDTTSTNGTQGKTGIKAKIENALHGNTSSSTAPSQGNVGTQQSAAYGTNAGQQPTHHGGGPAQPSNQNAPLHGSAGTIPPDVVNAQGGPQGAAAVQNSGAPGGIAGAGYDTNQQNTGEQHHHHHHHHHHGAEAAAGAGAVGVTGAAAAHHHNQHQNQPQQQQHGGLLHHNHPQQQQQQQPGYGANGALPPGAGYGATSAQAPANTQAGTGHHHSGHKHPGADGAVAGGALGLGTAEAVHHHHQHHPHNQQQGTATGATGTHGTHGSHTHPGAKGAVAGGAVGAGTAEAIHHHHQNHGTQTGAQTGSTGTTATGATKPTVGDKITGSIDTMVGKMTHNNQKVEEGMIKKTEGSAALPNHGAAAGSGGGYGTY